MVFVTRDANGVIVDLSAEPPEDAELPAEPADADDPRVIDFLLSV